MPLVEQGGKSDNNEVAVCLLGAMCCSLDKQTHGNFEVEEFSSFLSDKYLVAQGS